MMMTMMMVIRLLYLINLFFTPMLVYSISLKDCLRIRQSFIDQPLTIGTINNHKQLLIINKNLTMVNGSGDAVNQVFNLLTSENKILTIKNAPKNAQILHAYISQCPDQLIVTYRSRRGNLEALSVDLFTSQASSRGFSPKKGTQPILSDCKNRTMELKGQKLYLHDPKKGLFRICVKKASGDEDQLVIGAFPQSCQDETRSQLLFSNLKAGFYSGKNEKIYLLTKSSLLSFSSNLLTAHEKYSNLESKNIYEWLNCGGGQSNWIEGNMKESDEFVSQAAGMIFIFFLLFSLLVFHYMFPSVKK